MSGPRDSGVFRMWELQPLATSGAILNPIIGTLYPVPLTSNVDVYAIYLTTFMTLAENVQVLLTVDGVPYLGTVPLQLGLLYWYINPVADALVSTAVMTPVGGHVPQPGRLLTVEVGVTRNLAVGETITGRLRYGLLYKWLGVFYPVVRPFFLASMPG